MGPLPAHDPSPSADGGRAAETPAPGAAALILAAGAGTRFGERPKLLAAVRERPLLAHVVRAACAVIELDPIVVVLGSRAEEVSAEVDFGRAVTVSCPDWQDGLSASLRYGVASLPGADRVLVMVGDAPTINQAVIRRLLDAPAGARASFEGRPGHPVVLGQSQLARIGELRGDQGARPLLAGGALIECGDLDTGADVDTPADLTLVLATMEDRAASDGPVT